MKKALHTYTFITIWIIIIAITIAFVSTILIQFNLVKTINPIILLVLSLLMFLFAGIILGKKIIKKGLTHGIAVAIVYLLIVFSIYFLGYNTTPELFEIVVYFSKAGVLVLGSVIGVNLKIR